ncbi:MAG: hypothetical protein JWP91_1153 [Fibrobacteres bacterium]|nr:hypothetical protein [Fibrobacterota bacterium]
MGGKPVIGGFAYPWEGFETPASLDRKVVVMAPDEFVKSITENLGPGLALREGKRAGREPGREAGPLPGGAAGGPGGRYRRGMPESLLDGRRSLRSVFRPRPTAG